MRALAFNGPEDVEFANVPRPVPQADQALVRVETSALCGSELHADPAMAGSTGVLNAGHEAAGIVEHVPRRSGFQVGERVGVSAVTGCGDCHHCHRGVQLYCTKGWRIHRGMHAEYLAVPVEALRRLPQSISARDAVLLTGDTIGVPVRAHRRLPSCRGDRVLVLGLGPIGLGHTLVRAHLGAEVVAVEPSEYRRKLGHALGATEVLSPGSDLGIRPSLVIECTGIPECIKLALDSVDVGGTVLQSGECPIVEIKPSETFVRREVTYTGAWYYANEDVPEILRLHAGGLPLDQIVTHVFPAEQATEAYRTFVSKESGKVILDWQ